MEQKREEDQNQKLKKQIQPIEHVPTVENHFQGELQWDFTDVSFIPEFVPSNAKNVVWLLQEETPLKVTPIVRLDLSCVQYVAKHLVEKTFEINMNELIKEIDDTTATIVIENSWLISKEWTMKEYTLERNHIR